MIIYGVCHRICSTIIIRRWGAYPEGMSFAILIMNAVTPLINMYVKPKRFGEVVRHGGEKQSYISETCSSYSTVTTRHCRSSFTGICATTSPAEPIARSEKAETANRSRTNDVAPEFDNSPIDEQYIVTVNDLELKVFPAKKEGKNVGAAVESKTKKGFGGEISGYGRFQHRRINTELPGFEPCRDPGLGSKMEEWFRAGKGNQSILGKNPSTDNLTVKKDGGSIDAITAATISSRAFLDAIANAYAAYINNVPPPTGATAQMGKETTS